MLTVMIRSIILYTIVVITMRLMGKRQIGQLQPFELAIAVMISDLASLPMQDLKIPLVYGIIPIVTLLFLQTIITYIELKSEKSRSIICGNPSILIMHGKLDVSELKNQRLTFNDLIEELRLKGFYNISDVEFAILETNGQLSIIPKTKLTPVVKSDLNIQSLQENLPITLILDGKINYQNLKLIKKDKQWLDSVLSKNNISDINSIFFALLDSKHNFFYQMKTDN